eukprot:TRINITY_DN592_c0_g1_i1.p1 TRINITY_DN592_c0_g1~~TRINITY_DN592_c0_g1_i1.p1  ORF type:complete len:153 (+),score=15.06 TRINITY_DN592_c0_g1_i1:308-766(+)
MKGLVGVEGEYVPVSVDSTEFTETSQFRENDLVYLERRHKYLVVNRADQGKSIGTYSLAEALRLLSLNPFREVQLQQLPEKGESHSCCVFHLATGKMEKQFESRAVATLWCKETRVYRTSATKGSTQLLFRKFLQKMSDLRQHGRHLNVRLH